MALTKFIPNPVGLASLLESPGGPVGRDLARRAIRVESQAKVNASGRPGPNVITGRFRSSIHWLFVIRDGKLAALVGSNVEYARYLEEGSDRAPAYPSIRPALRAAR